MKWRIASVAFLLGALSTGLAWLTLQPVLVRLMDGVGRRATSGSPELAMLARLRTLLPAMLALDLIATALLTYFVLDFMVGRPLRQTESVVERLGRLELEAQAASGGGPLLSRVQAALGRMAEALRTERALTQSQLTALKEANARIAQAQVELVSAERLATVGELAAGVAHEVGNPLSGILGYLSLVRLRVAGNPEVTDYVERIEHELQRVDGIVRRLLDLGRSPSGQQVPLDLRELIEPCLRLMQAGEEFRQVEVLRDLPSLVVRADPGPLTQVVINLLRNAAQAMEGGGVVRVRARVEADQVWLDVEDDGPGIALEILPRLFEPFVTTKPAGKGTGLGLAVSLHLMTGMGGTLTAQNLPRGGARFSLRLPRG